MKARKRLVLIIMSGIMLVSVLFISGVILAMDKEPYYDIDRNETIQALRFHIV